MRRPLRRVDCIKKFIESNDHFFFYVLYTIQCNAHHLKSPFRDTALKNQGASSCLKKFHPRTLETNGLIQKKPEHQKPVFCRRSDNINQKIKKKLRIKIHSLSPPLRPYYLLLTSDTSFTFHQRH